MDKKVLGEKIKQAREHYMKNKGIKLTQQMLSEKINISRSYVGDIESGRTYPTFLVLKSIANVCDLPLSYFGEDYDGYAGHDEYEGEHINRLTEAEVFNGTSEVNIKRGHKLQHDKNLCSIVPVLGFVRAGEPILAQQNIIGYEYIPTEIARSGIYFGLKVSGDSMNNSRIFDGDTIIIRQQEDVENGEIAVVLVNREDATVKKIFKTDSLITLMPDSSNKEHQPRFIDIKENEVKILGKVVKVIINM